MLFNWHTWAGKTENAHKETKETRAALILSNGNPDLECANSGKSTLKSLFWRGSLLTFNNIRTFPVTKFYFPKFSSKLFTIYIKLSVRS